MKRSVSLLMLALLAIPIYTIASTSLTHEPKPIVKELPLNNTNVQSTPVTPTEQPTKLDTPVSQKTPTETPEEAAAPQNEATPISEVPVAPIEQPKNPNTYLSN